MTIKEWGNIDGIAEQFIEKAKPIYRRDDHGLAVIVHEDFNKLLFPQRIP